MASISPPYGARTTPMTIRIVCSDHNCDAHFFPSATTEATRQPSGHDTDGQAVYSYPHTKGNVRNRGKGKFQEFFRKMLGLPAPDRILSVNVSTKKGGAC